MNQNILINHEVLTLVFDILSQEIDAKLMVIFYLLLYVKSDFNITIFIVISSNLSF